MTGHADAPARYWREIIRSGMSQVPDDDPGWHDYLIAAYPGSAGVERFVVAAALLTFGHLDAAADVVDLLPDHPASVRVLARVLNALLPLDLDPYRSPGEVRQWLVEHRDQLVWVEPEGRFELAQRP